MLLTIHVCFISRRKVSVSIVHGCRILHPIDILLFLPYNIHHRVLESLFVLVQSVLLPGIVKNLVVEIVPLHTLFKHSDACLVVWRLLKLQSSAVLHKFLKF